MLDPAEFPRGNQTSEQTALASAARTAGANGAAMMNLGNRGVAIVVDITAGTGNILTVNLQAMGPSGTYTTIYSFAALTMTGVGQYHFCIYPGAASAASWKATPLQGPLPRHFRVTTTHTDATSVTYSVSVVQLP